MCQSTRQKGMSAETSEPGARAYHADAPSTNESVTWAPRPRRRRLHLAEQVHVVAADRQHVVASLQVNLGGFVVMPLDVIDRAQVDDHRSVDLRELVGVELLEQVL